MKTPVALAAALLLAASAAQAQTYSFSALLTPEASGATGAGATLVELDMGLMTAEIDVLFFGLSGTTTQAHIHCCTATPFTGTAGVAVTPGTLPSFPLGVQFGSYSTTLNLAQTSTYTTAFLNNNGGTASSAAFALLAGLQSGRAYLNIHTSTFGGGEIRGFLTPVPEPASWALMALGMVGIGALVSRRRG